MDAISSVVTGHLAGKLIDYAAHHFRVQVIERWSKHRAIQFFEEFCREVEMELAGSHSNKLDDCLSRILDDETCSEQLFDAYRRVSLAKSKTIGPRIIGILTAELVLERRTADEFEDAMFDAAENLADEELLGFARFYREQMRLAADPKQKGAQFDAHGGLEIEWCDEQLDFNRKSEKSVSIGPLDLRECLGPWASRMKRYGIISEHIRERHWEYSADSERHIDESGSVREICWSLCISKPFFRLAELIERVSRDSTTGPNDAEPRNKRPAT